MPEGKGKHLDRSDRDVLDPGVRERLSMREVSRRLHVAPSTVGREVAASRTVRPPNRRRGAMGCAGYRDCTEAGSACGKTCGSSLQPCKKCVTRDRAVACGKFVTGMCERTEAWPHVCPPGCTRRAHCGLPKCPCSAEGAQGLGERRASEPRSGIDLAEERLRAMVDVVVPPQRRGQGVEATWATHGDGLPVRERTFRRCNAQGPCGMAAMDMPGKVRYEPRKRTKGKSDRGRTDRTGRRCEGFSSLPEGERTWATQADTVVGRAGVDRQRLLTLRKPTLGFQLHVLTDGGGPSSVVAAPDALETYLGSPGELRRLFDPTLADRGAGFDDFGGMEGSCLAGGERRCRAYWCDAMQTNRKSPCECNHEELRRILPKGRCDFDALTPWDAALCTSHVSSYPRPGLGGAAPLDLAEAAFPAGFPETLGVGRMPAGEVTLRPSLVNTNVIPKLWRPCIPGGQGKEPTGRPPPLRQVLPRPAGGPAPAWPLAAEGRR